MGFLGQLFSAQNKFQASTPGGQDYNQALGQAVGQPGQTLSQEQQLASALQQQMQGGGPNLAQTQLQSATDRANKQAAGEIGAVRGQSPALAARQILNQQAANTQGAANQSAQLQQQQQLAAQQQLGNVLGQQGQLGLGEVGTLGNLQLGQGNQSLQAQALNEQAQLANQNAANSFLPNILKSVSGAGQAATAAGGAFHDGGMVDAMVSPGEMVIPPGGNFDDGGIVPGQAPMSGDHPENDTVPMKLKPGTVIAPRSVTNDGAGLDPERTADFVNSLNNATGYGAVLKAKKKLQSLGK